MKYYRDISIDQIVADFEAVRKFLKIDKWIVWGGSFGSTLSIHYGQTYPDSCTALFLRGLYLDTAEEVFAVYSRDTYLDHPKRLAEFDILYNYAKQSLSTTTTTTTASLDPNDAKGILQVYAELIEQGDELASWHWFVFENNLMELDPNEILDPYVIDDIHAPESLSVGFFETHLWLHGSFDDPPSDLLNPKAIRNLTFPIWVCQGNRDEVCPPQYARRFVDAVAGTARSPRVVARFLNATHEDTDPQIEACLKRSLREYVEVLGI
jgi:proline iminopeptidase